MSQRCSRCGYTNRKNQAEFQCLRCNNESNADVNAAINIRQRGEQYLLAALRYD